MPSVARKGDVRPSPSRSPGIGWFEGEPSQRSFQATGVRSPFAPYACISALCLARLCGCRRQLSREAAPRDGAIPIKLLHINASPRGEKSNTERVAAAFVGSLKEHHAHAQVDTVDPYNDDLPPVAGDNIEAKYTLMVGRPISRTTPSRGRRSSVPSNTFSPPTRTCLPPRCGTSASRTP